MSYASVPLIDALQRKVDRLEVENDLLRTAGGHASLTVARQSGKKDPIIALAERVEELDAENAKLRDTVERLQPTDSEGDALDIADTVHMLRSEYDGDHEWDDVVVELALAKWGGDRWIVRGARGEAWACDCSRTGHDEDAFEISDDVASVDIPMLLEVENTKLRELVQEAYAFSETLCEVVENSPGCFMCPANQDEDNPCGSAVIYDRMRELGVEVKA